MAYTRGGATNHPGEGEGWETGDLEEEIPKGVEGSCRGRPVKTMKEMGPEEESQEKRGVSKGTTQKGSSKEK